EGISEEIPSDYKEPLLFRIFDNKFSVIVCIVLIPIVLITTVGMPKYNFEDPFEEPEEKPKFELTGFTFEDSTSGYTNENQMSDLPIMIDEEKLTGVTCRLSWTDEPSQYFQGTNAPDEFKVVIIAPNGDEEDSGFSTSGSISASIELNYTEADFEANYLGEWIIRVEAGNCGDDSAFIALGGVRTTPDNGNDWDLEYSYQFMELVETTG
ncbi:MAG: hypothetical protein KAJ51_09100, partial [Thermoplasmata archaeon]|nr:hypothetical protein [Thermoplasmata archaeon]